MVESWQISLILAGLVSVGLCIVVCVVRSKRSDVLPPPQSTVVRHVYRESAYRVGNMSGCK